MIIGRMNSYYEDERLYSTGDYELDDLLERAFCDGYEYAQREFAEEDENDYEQEEETSKGKGHRGLKIAGGIAGGAALSAGGVVAADKIGKKIEGKAAKYYHESDALRKDWANAAHGSEAEKKLSKAMKKLTKKGDRSIKVGTKLQAPATFFKKAGKKVGDTAKKIVKRGK